MSGLPSQILSTFLAIALFLGCTGAKKLTSVLEENDQGNILRTYSGEQTLGNLVKEIHFYPNGDTMGITPMHAGNVHGVVSRFYPGNLLSERMEYKDGVQHGLFKRYDLEGTIVFEGTLVEGRKNGSWITWYDEIQMAEKGTYVNDHREGKWSYWFIDGGLKREEIYQSGELVSEEDFEE